MKYSKEYKSFFSMLAYRFIRGLVAGAIGTMVVVLVSKEPGDVMSLHIFFQSLGYAAIIGGISGGLMAADKAIRAQSVEE